MTDVDRNMGATKSGSASPLSTVPTTWVPLPPSMGASLAVIVVAILSPLRTVQVTLFCVRLVLKAGVTPPDALGSAPGEPGCLRRSAFASAVTTSDIGRPMSRE